MTPSNLCYRINEPDVTAESFEDEVVVINLANGRYHSLRGAGAWLWHALAAGMGRQDAIDHILAQDSNMPPDAADRATAFMEQLTQEDLLVPDPERVPDAPPSLPSHVDFLTPLIETFTDMENLLAIDPIHEVDMQVGWPHAPRQA